MGSLMSGWNSHVLGDRRASLMRNRSLTMEEVDAFWRQRGRTRPSGNHNGVMLSPPPPLPSPSSQEILIPLAAAAATARRLEVSRSMPPRLDRGGDLCSSSLSSSPRSEPPECLLETAGAGDGITTSWWTRSSWAFLNEPPKDKQACDAARIVTGDT